MNLSIASGSSLPQRPAYPTCNTQQQSEQLCAAQKDIDLGEYKEAYETLTKLVKENCEAAEFYLADLYKQGLGTERNPQEAMRLYQLVAQRDVDNAGKAYERMGLLHEWGFGDTLPNYVEAIDCYQKALEKGNADGCFYLGLFYRAVDGIEPDEDISLDWHIKGARLGSAKALNAIERWKPDVLHSIYVVSSPFYSEKPAEHIDALMGRYAKIIELYRHGGAELACNLDKASEWEAKAQVTNKAIHCLKAAFKNNLTEVERDELAKSQSQFADQCYQNKHYEAAYIVYSGLYANVDFVKVRGCERLGSMLLNGHGVRRDITWGAEVLRQMVNKHSAFFGNTGPAGYALAKFVCAEEHRLKKHASAAISNLRTIIGLNSDVLPLLKQACLTTSDNEVNANNLIMEIIRAEIDRDGGDKESIAANVVRFVIKHCNGDGVKKDLVFAQKCLGLLANSNFFLERILSQALFIEYQHAASQVAGQRNWNSRRQ